MKIYIKKTNTFCYLLYSSSHPKFVKDNMPKSLFLRIRRICSSFIDYLAIARQLSLNLIKRGFELSIIYKVSAVVGGLVRNSLLEYRIKGKLSRYNEIIWPIEFNSSFKNLNTVIYKSWEIFFKF